MRHLPIGPDRVAAIIFLAVIVAVLGDCSNSSVTPVMRTASPSHGAESAGYNLTRVDYSNSANMNTQLTGINSSGEVVGNYAVSSYSTNAPWNNFTSVSPYSSFQNVQFPYGNAAYTYLYAISDDSSPIVVGYVSGPNSQTGYWGVVRSQGIWSITRRVGNNEENCPKPNWKHALLGYDTVSRTAVGYYTDTPVTTATSCPIKPYELEIGDNFYTKPFKNVPTGWSNTEATGIVSNGATGKEDIVGSTTLNNGDKAGWILSTTGTTSAVPTSFRCCDTGHFDTVVNGVTFTTGPSPHELIVGSYNSSGSTWKGFVYDKTATGIQWTTIVAFGSNKTVVSGINASKTICGWYVDSGPRARGFVATFSGMPQKRHHGKAPLALKGP